MKPMRPKNNIYLFILLAVLLFSACEFFQKKTDKIVIPEDKTEEQLEAERYSHKKETTYKDKFIYQNKTDSLTVTVFNVIDYKIRDDGTNIGDGYVYYIFDIAVDNPGKQPFNIGAFTRSCHLTNEDPNHSYSNIGFALKMYHLQSDSAEIDMEYTKRFYLNSMPPKELYRTKLFAFEVSKDDKSPLFLRYTISGRPYEMKIRDQQY